MRRRTSHLKNGADIFQLCMQSSAVCQNAYKTDFEEVKNSFTQNVRQTQDALTKFAAKMERKLRNDDGTIECVYFFFNFLEFYQKYIQVNTNRLPDKCNYAIRESLENIFPNFFVIVSITFMDFSKKYNIYYIKGACQLDILFPILV